MNTPNGQKAHTPGPWTVSIYETPRNRTNPKQYTVIAKGMTIRVSGYNQEANTQLIADAPETAILLTAARERIAALEAALRHLTTAASHLLESNNGWVLADAVDEARTVLSEPTP